MKRIICLACLLLLLNGCSNILEKKENSVNTELNNKIQVVKGEEVLRKNMSISIDKEIILNNLKNICSGVRKFGTEGESISLKYLQGKLEEYGYITYIQEFQVYKQDLNSTYVKYYKDYFKNNPYSSESFGTGKNIIAKSYNYLNTRKTMYITAHYDTTSNTGVIDNGTGVSVVLEVARQLVNYDLPFNLQIVLFSAEEYFRSGSRAFVSNLTDAEKKNAIGCINVDMVGEKDAGELVMMANNGEHNIITLMMHEKLENKLSVIKGGYSDDLSFYLSKIPAITLINKNPDPSRAKEKDQFQFIDVNELSNTAYLISNFLINFDIDTYNKFLNDRIFTSNKTNNLHKESIQDGFELKEINAILLENGYDSKTEYNYENKNGNKYVIAEKFIAFVEPTTYSFKALKNNYSNSESFKCLYFINDDANSDIRALFTIDYYFREIIGDISIDKAQSIIEDCYEQEYKRIFKD